MSHITSSPLDMPTEAVKQLYVNMGICPLFGAFAIGTAPAKPTHASPAALIAWASIKEEMWIGLAEHTPCHAWASRMKVPIDNKFLWGTWLTGLDDGWRGYVTLDPMGKRHAEAYSKGNAAGRKLRQTIKGVTVV